jgi:hypothetical protein
MDMKETKEPLYIAREPKIKLWVVEDRMVDIDYAT